MRKLKLYLETTMFNYYFDSDRDAHADTVRLFAEIRDGKYRAYTSDYVIYELQNAPEPKRSRMLALIEDYNLAVLKIDEESERLANVYVEKGVVPLKYRFDAAHIAIATVHGMDYILSCNFQHINNLKTKNRIISINLVEGYQPGLICTPMEVVES